MGLLAELAATPPVPATRKPARKATAAGPDPARADRAREREGRATTQETIDLVGRACELALPHLGTAVQEDVASELVLKVWAKHGPTPYRSDLRSRYLKHVATTLASRAQLRPASEAGSEPVESDGNSLLASELPAVPAISVDAERLTDALHLDVDCSAAVTTILSGYGGAVELADALNLKLNTARVRITRGRKKLPQLWESPADLEAAILAVLPASEADPDPTRPDYGAASTSRAVRVAELAHRAAGGDTLATLSRSDRLPLAASLERDPLDDDRLRGPAEWASESGPLVESLWTDRPRTMTWTPGRDLAPEMGTEVETSRAGMVAAVNPADRPAADRPARRKAHHRPIPAGYLARVRRCTYWTDPAAHAREWDRRRTVRQADRLFRALAPPTAAEVERDRPVWKVARTGRVPRATLPTARVGSPPPAWAIRRLLAAGIMV